MRDANVVIHSVEAKGLSDQAWCESRAVNKRAIILASAVAGVTIAGPPGDESWGRGNWCRRTRGRIFDLKSCFRRRSRRRGVDRRTIALRTLRRKARCFAGTNE